MIESTTLAAVELPREEECPETAFRRALAPRFVAHPLNFHADAKPLLDEAGSVCLEVTPESWTV